MLALLVRDVTEKEENRERREQRETSKPLGNIFI